jgi:hypothetical protein
MTGSQDFEKTPIRGNTGHRTNTGHHNPTTTYMNIQQNTTEAVSSSQASHSSLTMI